MLCHSTRSPLACVTSAVFLLLWLPGGPQGTHGSLLGGALPVFPAEEPVPNDKYIFDLNTGDIGSEQLHQDKESALKQEGCSEDEPLHCLTCLNAATEAECKENGTLVPCSAAQTICAVFTVEQDDEVYLFSRMCHTRAACVTSGLGPPGKYCDVIDEKAVCTYCEFGEAGVDYLCGAVAATSEGRNPCDEAAGETVWCRSCTNVASEEECRTTGTLVECPSAKYACEVSTHETQAGQVKRYSRGCSLRSQCESTRVLFGKPKMCTGHKDALNCKYCDLGVKNEDYGCTVPTPAEQNPCDEANEEALWCMSCDAAHNATHCRQVGTFKKCPHPNSVCEVRSRQAGFVDSMIYSRACQNRTSCHSNSLGPDSMICSGLDQSCSYCEFGEKDQSYKCSAEPCDKAAGESLWCLECSGATSLFDCALKGTFQECAGKEVACHSEVITKTNGRDKTFNRKCMSRTRCPSVQLGVANTVCRQDGDNVKCSYCDFGLPDVHFQCKPDVCDFMANETLQCLTCTDASSLTHCHMVGEFKPCTGDQPVCETAVTYVGSAVAGVTRRCGVKTQCGVEGEAALGASAAICQNRDGRKVCSYCDYGAAGQTYFCSPAIASMTSKENTICPGDDPFGCHTSLESAASRIDIAVELETNGDLSEPRQRSKRDLSESVTEWEVGESGDGSGETDGSGSGWAGFSEALCSAELGEAPACWTCIKASSDGDCWAHGSYEPCLIPDPVCEYAVMTSTGFGTTVKEVTRQCSSRDYCYQGNNNNGNTVSSDYSVDRQCGHETLGVEYICVDPSSHSSRRKRDASEAPGCHEKETQVFTCHTSTEPYIYNTFDGRSVEFEGDCKYLLASTPPMWQEEEAIIGGQGGEELIPFEVFVKKERGGQRVEYIELRVGQPGTDEALVITMHRGSVYMVNGTEVLPAQLPSTHYYTNTRYVKLIPTGANHVSLRTSHGGVTLGYDGDNFVHIQLPHQYIGKGIQGLCGNLNGIWSDDMVNRQGEDVSHLGQRAAPAAGYSWQVADPIDARCFRSDECECEAGGICVPNVGVCHCPEHRTGQRCQHEVIGLCEAKVDPGFRTFDGAEYDFTGPCRYLLTGTSDVIPLHFIQFNVYVEGDDLGAEDHRRSRSVNILYGATEIYLRPDFVIMVNGRAVSDDVTQVKDALILQDGVRVMVITDFGLTVTYDGYYNVKITVADYYSGYLSGLCGNMDFTTDNDMTNACGHNVQGLHEDAGVAMGTSWMTSEVTHNKTECREKSECDTCHGGLYLGGDVTCRCPVHQAGSHCQYNVSAQCVALEEPHYRTFDGAMLHYEGSCKYLLAGTTPALPTHQLLPFTVHVKKERSERGTRSLYVAVAYKGHLIQMDRFSNVEVDGLSVELPHRAIQGVDIHTYRGTSARIRMFFGLTITINNLGRVTVRIPQKYSGFMQGLCGNYNHNQHDDFTTRDGAYVGDDKSARTALVGNSWRQTDSSDIGCLEPYEDEIPDVSKLTASILHTQAHCDLLFNTSLSDNPFSACITKLGNISLMYLETCVFVAASAASATSTFDMPHLSHSPRTCGVIETFAEECRFVAGVPVIDWRWKTGCELECPTGMEAGMLVPSTTPSCSSRSTTLYDELLGEGCICPWGMVLSGTRCLPRSQCGCVPGDGHYHSLNTKWLSHDCGALNKCLFGIQQAMVMTKPYQCPGDAQCIKENGKLTCQYECNCMNGGTCIPSIGKCRCPWNFIGKHCETEVTCCKAWGDPHYLTFTGMAVDFMGECRYQLTGTCPNSTNFEHLLVTAVNAPLQPDQSRMSSVREVSIELAGHKVDLIKGGRIEVDEEPSSAPIELDDMTITRTPYFLLLQTHNLLVRLDDSAAEICLPVTHSDKLCGICGPIPGATTDENSNESADDEINRDWQNPVTSPLEDVCQHPSTAELKQQIHQPQPSWKTEVDNSAHLCGLLHPFILQGPFYQCWLNLDQQVRSAYHASCRYDVYSLEHDGIAAHAAACRILAATAQVCLSLGHDVTYLDKAQCRPGCAVGQYYQENIPSCPATCTDPMAPRFCQLSHLNGCGCAPGRLLSDEGTCVEPQLCGCLDSNQTYHQPGSHWYNKDCTVHHACQPASQTVGSRISNSPGCDLATGSCVLKDQTPTCVPNKVDGGWGPWGDWSSCTESPLYPNARLKVRVRSCDAPAPSADGRHCEGASVDNDFNVC